MELIGFMQNADRKVIEYLPYSHQMKNLNQRRALFFNMYNFYMEKDLQFKKSEYLGSKDILSVFTKKIDSLLKACKKAKVRDTFKPDIASTKIIHAYQNGTTAITSKKPKLQVAKLIKLIHGQDACSLMMDLDDMFLNLVYERIKKVNRGSEVVLGEKEIIIYDPETNSSPTVVIPFYKSIQKQNMRENSIVVENINLAMDHLRGEKVRQIFLVFPKSDGFSKHMDLKFHNDIKLEDNEYRVKMIPYSFSFCIRNQKRRLTHGDRHILRK